MPHLQDLTLSQLLTTMIYFIFGPACKSRLLGLQTSLSCTGNFACITSITSLCDVKTIPKEFHAANHAVRA